MIEILHYPQERTIPEFPQFRVLKVMQDFYHQQYQVISYFSIDQLEVFSWEQVSGSRFPELGRPSFAGNNVEPE